MKCSKSLFWLVTFVFSITFAEAQQVSEAEVNLQKIFIEASKEKILGNYENAASLFKEVLKADKSNHAAAYELARIYDVLKEEDKAVKYIKIAVDELPGNTWYQKFMADLYQKTEDFDEAAKVYENLVKQDPNNEYFYYKWAYFLVRSNDINKALKVYDDLEAKIGINEEIIRRKHTLYMGTGNDKKAEKELERLIQAFPKNVDYQHLLASYYEQIGDQDNAKAIYQKILDIDPNDVKAKLALAGVSRKDQNELFYLQTLKPIFEQAELDIDTKIGKIYPFIGKVAEEGNQEIAKATLELTEILEKVHPDEAKAFSASGDLLYYSGKRKEALEKYKQTLERDETVFLVWEQVMYIYLEEQNYEELLKTSENALDIFPNRAIAHYMNGIALEGLEKSEDAIYSLEQALLMSGNNQRLQLDIQTRLGTAYFNTKAYSKSDNAFEEALKLNPEAPDVLNNYSYYLSVRGEQLEKAKEMSAKSNELVPNQPSLQDTYGWILYKMKDYQDAKEWIGKALKNGGANSPTILEHYGDILFQLGDVDGATNYWTQALENGGKSEFLEKKIADRKLYE